MQTKIEIAPDVTARIQKRANIIARRNGYGKATQIVLGAENKVVKHTSYGWVKNTTGERVPNAYRMNFGWKNTHYVSAETVVMVAI